MAPDRAAEIEVQPVNGAPRSAEEKDPDAFPYKQLTILAICRFSEPIAFNSILAYTYLLVRDLRGTEQDASFYAGLLVSAYAVAEAMTAMGWGALSDRYGRKPVVLLGLGGVALSCLIFGLAKNYWVALLARFIGGLLNGNVSVMQTMVAESVKNPAHEPKAYATQPFVWVLGGIIGSAMGGFLAQPASFYPDYFAKDGLFGRHPYLLPNLVAMAVILIAIIQGYIFLQETNPRAWRHRATSDLDEQAISDDDDDDTMQGSEEDVIDERTPLNGRAKRHSSASAGYNPADRRVTGPVFMEESLPLPVDQNFDLRRASMSTVASFRGDGLRGGGAAATGSGSGCIRDQLPKPTGNDSNADYDGPVYSFRILMLSLAMVLVSYHQMAFSALFPITLLDKPAIPYPVPHSGRVDFTGGLGYDLHDVGKYLATNGGIGLFIQGVIFPVFVERVGVWRSFVLMVALYPTAYLLMPFISAMPNQEIASMGLYLSMMMQSFYGIISMPCALILLKDSIPHASVLGRVNGLAMSGCCLARTISPPLGGIIYSAGGSASAWFSCAGVALLGIVQLFWIPSKPALPTAESGRGDDGENGVVTVDGAR